MDDIERLKRYLMIALDSQYPAEAFTVLKRINKLLEKMGHDKYWLVDRLLPLRPIVPLEQDDWKIMLRVCMEWNFSLEGKAHKFINDIAEKNLKANKELTPAQYNWLRNIYKTIGIVSAAAGMPR